jgi:hypothetical protein
MIRVSKMLFVTATSLVISGGVALADKHAASSKGDDNASGGDGAEPAKLDTSDSASGEYTKENWPKAAIDRPLTAAKGMIELTPMLTFGHASVAGADSVNSEGATVALRYGLSDKLELDAAYSGIVFNPDSNFKGALAVGVGFNAIHGAAGGKLDVAPKAAFVYDLAGETAQILAGADVHYKLSDKLFIGTPTNVPGLAVTVKGADVMGTSVNPITFAIPFAVGFQAMPELQLQASTIVANINIKDSATSYISDVTPVTIDAIYALSNKMDVRVDLSFPDLQHAGDALAIAAGLNLRM